MSNKKCSWSYRSPKITRKCINMEGSKESHRYVNTFSDEMPQNRSETVITNEILEESKDDYWNTSDKTDLKQNVLRNLKRDAHSESDSDKRETHAKANNEFLNEESVYESLNKVAELQSSHSSKKEYNEQNIDTIFNESAVSNDSSSDEEVLQTRFPMQNEDGCNSPKSSVSFASISNKESITEDYSEIKKPIIIQARAYNEKETVDCEFDDSNSETIKQAEKNEHQDINKRVEKTEQQDTNKQAENIEQQDAYKQIEKTEYQDTNKQAKKHEHQDTNKQAKKCEHQDTNKQAKKCEHQDTNKQAKKREHQDTNKLAEKNKHQKATIDVANSLSVEADNSNIETESSFRQNSIKNKNTDLNFDKIKDRSEISPEKIINTEKNENTFNQSIQDRNDISPDTIINDFLNGSFDISIFKPNKNSTMIKDDKTVRKQKQSIKDYHSSSKEKKYRKNTLKNTNEKIHREAGHKKLYNDNKQFVDSTDDSMINLKRKISENQVKNVKKAKTITEKNKDEITSTALDNFNKYVLKPKTKSENKYSKTNNHHKRITSGSKYNDKDIKLLSNFDMENNKKNKIKNNAAKIKSHKNEEIFKDFSHKTAALKKSRSLRNSSLVASKKIKEIEKLENVDSNEEITLDSGSSCFDANIKKIDTSFKSIFKNQDIFPKYKAESKLEKDKFHNEDIMDIVSLDDSPVCLEKEGKMESKITKSNRKRKSEDIFDACRITNECQLRMDNITSKDNFISDTNELKLLVKENEDSNENNKKNKKSGGNRRQRQSNKLTKNKFHNEDIMDNVSLDDSEVCLEKEGKLESKITKSNRKRKSEDIFDACRITNECQLRMDNITSKDHFISDTNELNLLMKENEDSNENNQKNKKSGGNRRQRQSNKLTKNKSLEYGKKIDKISPYKDDVMNVNYGVTTRSKKKTWSMLEKELLGESNDASFSNNVTKTVLLKEKSITRRNLKDVDLYSVSDKSVIRISMPTKTSKCDGKYKTQNTEFKHLQTPANEVQSNEIIPYKSQNILEKTIAAMEKCTANFIAPKEKLTEKEWIYSEAELDDMSIDQEAEFHSNMTFVTNENEQCYKNKIVAILKHSSSKKNENLRRRTRIDSGEFKYEFGDAEHVVKKSIITETYSLKDNSEENLKLEDQALIVSSGKKQSEPWSRLIKELNLEQSKDENKNKDSLIGTPSRITLIYHENVNVLRNVLPDKDTKERKKTIQNEIEKEESEEEVTNSTFEKNPIQSNHMAICYDLNVQGTVTHDTESNRDADLDNVCTREKMEKVTTKIEIKQRQVLQMRKSKTSPKFKLQVVDDGGVKLKRCNRSFSSSSEESIKQKQGNTRKDEINLERKKYKRYLNNLFEEETSLSEKRLEKDKRKAKCMTEEKSHKNNLVKDSDAQRRMFKALIAKDDDDVFSISSSDSEAVNKGSGLLCDLFDE